MTIAQYIETINKRYTAGISREHSYRGDFENLYRSLIKEVEITNEPANVTDCGNPDYVLTKGKIPIGYIEAKDIGKDLNSKSYKEQFGRYRKALDNLIITDYIWFQFFQNGELVHEIRIAEIDNGAIKPLPENYTKFENLLGDFSSFIGQTIKSSKRLAEMMAAKARLLQNILERAVNSDEKSQENTSIQSQYSTFKQVLIHDLKPKSFADIYAQTLAYGMFAARLHDPTLEDFSRQEAAELIPKSNPFLRRLFGYVAGADIDERIKTTVDNLADVFRATDVKSLLKDFGKSTQQNDPMIHFYETFLGEYDPKLKKKRGVWFTPEPVVKFIVRAVDDILKTEFDIPQGLADTSKTKIKVQSQKADKRFKDRHATVEKEVHRVQILDPATGTGTFLAEVIKHIYSTRFKAMQGAWSGYVEEHLIPRLNGFELLMASYSMAHLKLDMLLTETGYKSTVNQRFNVFLTNSLEEHHPDTGTLFSSWLSSEANEANYIKRDTPVMCVIGNPPYAVSSSNKGKWIDKLIFDYKRDLDEKSYNSLSDDYVKFIRYGQNFIEKNGSGVLAYISNNSFIDGIVFRQMRKHLLECFDLIYIIDLHGNAQRKEVSPDGSVDKNVFDIMQGVSINLFIKTGKKKKSDLGKLLHFDLYGKRNYKYKFLNQNSIGSIKWNVLKNIEPYYFFVEKDFSYIDSYMEGFKIDKIFLVHKTGLNTECDELAIQNSKSESETVLNILRTESEDAIIEILGMSPKKIKKVENAKKDIAKNHPRIIKIKTKPFEEKYCIYTGKSNGVMGRPRNEVMQHLKNEDNIGLISMRQYAYNVPDYCYTFISKSIVASRLFISNKGYCSVFPLYLNPEDNGQQTIDMTTDRKPNLNLDIVIEIEKKLGLTFTAEKGDAQDKFAPIDILDYIYAVLHSPKYRKRYEEFLQIDFPRVPYPKGKEIFWQLVELGSQIRQIHLLESPKVQDYITSYPENGDNTVTTKIDKKDWELYDEAKELGRIRINKKQYFDKIPVNAWEFYIGGYQPAQKWLKDRIGTELSYDDILHYQKIIVALSETERLMQEIDKIEIE